MSSSLLTKDTVIKCVCIAQSLPSYLRCCRVSSTLDKSVGKKNLIDGSPETCWTSQQGLPQYIQVAFERPARPEIVFLTFQGGFVGKTCIVTATQPGSNDWQEIGRIYPDDVNRQQTFPLSTQLAADRLRLTFQESTDFFGRITIYDFSVHGSLADA
ncbi:galactose-binding domain-like protein [Schizophyllum amplum]|uniref:Galactose-binding domain-like protein n=1 Tax=Schizophyllum amplum TaxID=97359 RepID=A0A550C9W9_9AGAR|nr:galactose-binding domain-like protein [Auriculariopsis ampla]